MREGAMEHSNEDSWSWSPELGEEGMNATTSSGPLSSNAGDGRGGTCAPHAGRPVEAADPAVKPKITKSRNGCVTCKAKRLKCDETKPTCLQCKKRNVDCGGYKKDFKWKSFEESSFMKSGNRKKASAGASDESVNFKEQALAAPSPRSPGSSKQGQTFSSSRKSTTTPFANPSVSAATTPSIQQQQQRQERDQYQNSHSQSPHAVQFGHGASVQVSHPSSDTSSSRSPASTLLSSPMQFSSAFDPVVASAVAAASSIHGTFQDLGHAGMQQHATYNIQQQPQEMGRWPSGAANSHFSYSPHAAHATSLPHSPIQSAFDAPGSYLSSQDQALLSVFVNDTADVISMEKGDRNPWRKLMLPMSRTCPSLMHAILAFTAFRAASRQPQWKALGIAHKAEALKHLSNNLAGLTSTQALATTLALSIAEAFDSSQTLPEQYLLLSRSLVARILAEIQQGISDAEELEVASFVMNDWLYLDVMTSLTSKTHAFDVAMSHEVLVVTRSLGLSPPVDSCMGIAASLFPFVGRVANLIRLVRQRQMNDANIVADAENLKQLLTRWGPIHAGSSYGLAEEDIEDYKCTSEAFRWASLLLLHQAVPEISLRESSHIATRILKLLRSVRNRSPCLMFHTFPLLMAGSELVDGQTRSWVMTRWQEIEQMLQVGIVGKCVELTSEVWRRRDGATAKSSAMASRPNVNFAGDNQGSPMQLHGQDRLSVFPGKALSGQYGSLNLDILASNQVAISGPPAENPQYLQPLQGEILGEDDILRILNETMGPSSLVQHQENAGFAAVDMSGMQRRSPEAVELVPYEQTVRGNQHWLGVMEEWGWEVCIG